MTRLSSFGGVGLSSSCVVAGRGLFFFLVSVFEVLDSLIDFINRLLVNRDFDVLDIGKGVLLLTTSQQNH